MTIVRGAPFGASSARVGASTGGAGAGRAGAVPGDASGVAAVPGGGAGAVPGGAGESSGLARGVGGRGLVASALVEKLLADGARASGPFPAGVWSGLGGSAATAEGDPAAAFGAAGAAEPATSMGMT